MSDLRLGILMGTIGIPMVAGAMTGWYGSAVGLGLWTVAGIAWVVVARARAERPIVAVAVAGASSGVFAGAMQAVFLGTLVANNEAWSTFSVDASTRLEAFVTALPIGIVWGLLFGAIAWGVGRLAAGRDQARPTRP